MQNKCFEFWRKEENRNNFNEDLDIFYLRL